MDLGIEKEILNAFCQLVLDIQYSPERNAMDFVHQTVDELSPTAQMRVMQVMAIMKAFR
jgi:hypothetical protein